jgi:hypothetical protein
VNDQGPAGILYNLVRSQISDSATLAEVEMLVQTSAMTCEIDEAAVIEVLTRFRAELNPEERETPLPRLLVDWGDLPCVGHQVRPEFSLLCAAYSSRPDVQISIDQDLDHDATHRLQRPEQEEAGLWTFHVPFRMTTDARDCRPGQYVIDVRVSFRDVPPELPRFFRCRFRLNVSDASAEEGGVLEIDGDGQSMVNLQGYNLKQFSKVVLKGGADSVINLQNAIGGSDEDAVSADADTKPATTFEYELKVDTQKQSRLPTVTSMVSQRSYLDAASLCFEDGRRTLLFTRPRLSLGRSRDNDVILRFLPRGEENDGDSRNISRTHFLCELTTEGVEIRDQSRSGIEVNNSVVEERVAVAAHYAGDVTAIDLGVTGTVPRSFRLEMLMFTPDRNTERDELEFWDELYCELIGGRLSRPARQALDVGLDAVRFDRTENLAGEEAYVLLLREALIGSSPSQSAVVLKDSNPQTQARLLHMDRSFWLERLPGSRPISVDETPLSLRTLTPLSPGMTIQFGSEVATFDRPAQLYLD